MTKKESPKSIAYIWRKSEEIFYSKSLAQILSFAGTGKLKDENSTSKEFRDFLNQVPTRLISKFANDCLIDKFENSGFALQDLINQMGIRLGFNVEHGLYRGKPNEIGYDGIWTSNEGYSIILEVKTTDAYRINLDTLAEYRNKLIEKNRINNENSSVLIVVGREDTGDLEAQIRGSRHAWDVRLLSTDSLIKLLDLKESLNDSRTIQQINQLLKPTEYTRIDKLIELIFLTTKDLQIDELIDEEFDKTVVDKSKKEVDKTIPVSFYEECMNKIRQKLGMTFIKQSRISFSNKEKSTALVCSISKPYAQGQNQKYWFAFHPHQREFLRDFKNAYIAFGCGSPEFTFLIPFKILDPLIDNLWTTQKEDRMYWHVFIHEIDGKFMFIQPRNTNLKNLDITKFKI